MGLMCSSGETRGTAVSKKIDEDIRAAKNQIRHTVKLLLLGAGESGKSTVVKQMKVLHDNGYSVEERRKYVPVIRQNALQSTAVIMSAMERLEIPFAKRSLLEHMKNVSSYFSMERTASLIIQKSLSDFWADAGVQTCYRRSNEYHLNDSAKYFLDKAEIIFDEEYVPTVQDVLRTRLRTEGIVETNFTYKKLTFQMVDVGGQRSERKKWIMCFQGVTAVIFCVALSGYDQKLMEDEETNRMVEALKLFEEICNHRMFGESSMILFLNKKDIFEQKIQVSPLSVCFPDYEGKNKYDEASAFIERKFLALNRRSDDKVYTHFTCATDTSNMEFVFSAVTDVIVRNNLKETGFY
ncbi:unnamed protein product [Notodromas monacha]|uniref:Guanine nucleotide-binding protein G(I) subunit alpha n=1 Tax=Notodromas monacha TaxID=399045 RepID=A0A7R9BLP6_9CRUS|nr:unnamed protein product [Notodromas monacha]CAG0917788.1 unnamed protein product [Notodromas monacha]